MDPEITTEWHIEYTFPGEDWTLHARGGEAAIRQALKELREHEATKAASIPCYYRAVRHTHTVQVEDW